MNQFLNIFQKLWLPAILFSLPIMLPAQSPVPYQFTLQEAIEKAIDQNLTVRQGKIQMGIKGIDKSQAQLDRLPTLEGYAGSGINQGRSIDPFTNSFVNQRINFSSYSLNADWVLFNGFSRQLSVQEQNAAHKASSFDWEQAKNEVTIQVILAYLQVLMAEDLLAQVQVQEKLSQEQVNRLAELDKQGAIPPATLYDLKGQLANDQLAISAARNTLATAEVNFCRLLNIPYQKRLQLQRIEMPPATSAFVQSVDSVYHSALQSFALIKASEQWAQSAKYGYQAERGRLLPTLSLNAGANTNYSSAARDNKIIGVQDVLSDDYVVVNGNSASVIKRVNNVEINKISYYKQLNNNLYSRVSLNLRIPIFLSFQQRNRVKKAKLNWENAELIEKTSRTQLQQDIRQAHINMSTAAERLNTLEEQVKAYELSYQAAEVRFEEGVGTSIDFLTARTNLDRSKVNLLSAKYEFWLRSKVLDYYKGNVLW